MLITVPYLGITSLLNSQVNCVLDQVMNQEEPSHTPRCINKDDLLNSRWIRRSGVSYKVMFSSNERAPQTNWEMVKGGGQHVTREK